MGQFSEITSAAGDLITSPKFAGFGAISTTALWVLLNHTPNAIGLSDTPSIWKAAIALICVCCWSGLLIQVISHFITKHCQTKAIRKRQDRLLNEFPKLSPTEAAILVYAHEVQESVVTLPLTSANAVSLRTKGFIRVPAGVTKPLESHHPIDPFVRDHLGAFCDSINQDPESRKTIDSIIRDYRKYIRQPVFYHDSW